MEKEEFLDKEKVESIQDALHTLKKILQLGIDGIGPLSSAKELANQYLRDLDYSTKGERIDALEKWEIRKNFTTGFITSLGGLITLPITIPASLAINWVIQTRMAAAMAYIWGFDIDDPPVRITIALSLLGKKGKEILNANRYDFEQIMRKKSLVSKQSILFVNQLIASQLVRIATQKGMTKVSKAVPFVGGLVGGVLDYKSCKETATFARELFQIYSMNGVEFLAE